MVRHAIDGLLELMTSGSVFMLPIHKALGATNKAVEPSEANVSARFVIPNI